MAVKDFDLFLQAIKEISPVPIRFDEISGSANGYYHTVDKEIVIKKGLSESQTLKTAIHESAHARLHDKETMENLGEEKDRLTKEVEAESVAYCVCSAFELDTSEYSFPYIAGWSSGREMKELKASMDVIRKTAGEMIDQLREEIDALIEEKQALGITPKSEERDLLEDSSCISFYAAECSEFPVLGEVHQDLSLSEALEAYEKIPSDRMNGIKSVGFNLQEGSDYDGMMDLLVGNLVQRELLDSIPFFKENKRVQTALERVEKYMEERHPAVDKSEKKEQKEQNTEVKKTKSQKRKEDLSL